MGIRDTLKSLSAIINSPDAGDGLLEPLLASQGIEAAHLAYDPATSQVVLALRISGQTRFTCLPIGRTFTRAEICRLIAGPGPTGPGVPDASMSAAPALIASQIEQAKPPPNAG